MIKSPPTTTSLRVAAPPPINSSFAAPIRSKQQQQQPHSSTSLTHCPTLNPHSHTTTTATSGVRFAPTPTSINNNNTNNAANGSNNNGNGSTNNHHAQPRSHNSGAACANLTGTSGLGPMPNLTPTVLASGSHLRSLRTHPSVISKHGRASLSPVRSSCVTAFTSPQQAHPQRSRSPAILTNSTLPPVQVPSSNSANSITSPTIQFHTTTTTTTAHQSHQGVTEVPSFLELPRAISPSDGTTTSTAEASPIGTPDSDKHITFGIQANFDANSTTAPTDNTLLYNQDQLHSSARQSCDKIHFELHPVEQGTHKISAPLIPCIKSPTTEKSPSSPTHSPVAPRSPPMARSRRDDSPNPTAPHSPPMIRCRRDDLSILDDREEYLNRREQELNAREQKLFEREEAVAKKELEFQQRVEDHALKEALKAAAITNSSGKALKSAYGTRQARNGTSSGKIGTSSGSLAEMTEKQQIEVLTAFNNIDTNGNGVIDCTEFFQGLQLLYPEVTKPEANRIYGQIDINRDGLVTLDEFMRAVVQYQWDTSLWRERHRVTTSSENYEWEIPHSELKMIEKLGEGSFGIVYKSKWRNCDVAVKELKAQNVDARLMKAFKQEIAILASLRHPNIVLYMGACTHMPHLSICTEFLSGGSVYQLLHERNDTKIDLEMALHLAKQMAVGLCHLHSLHPKIIHRDCKSENLLLDSHFALKLCDFGLSIVEPSDGSNLTERVGSPLWMSPEMLTRSAYTEKTDVYSFGVCLWEMISAEVPFGHITEMSVLVDTVARKGQRPKIPSGCPALLVEIITNCWCSSPATRPNLREVIPRLDRLLEALQLPNRSS
ncbi:protein kinase [Pelomyxa schiedti]|nr:protein kinase [Pelomyxa schiedti]